MKTLQDQVTVVAGAKVSSGKEGKNTDVDFVGGMQ